MANRHNHYEAAFEAYLRALQMPYVAVDEARRSLLGDTSIKSVDFIVSTPQGASWLVDVKGRRFPSGLKKRYWKNWSTLDDLRSMFHWEQLFGERFGGLFVFSYHVVGNRSPLPTERLFPYRDRLYGFVGVRLREYAQHARTISPRWDTVAMSAGRFRKIAAPLDAFLGFPWEGDEWKLTARKEPAMLPAPCSVA